MAAPMQAPMPELPLTNGATLKAEAIDPLTGSAVSGVSISAFTLYGLDNGAGSDGSTSTTPPNILGAYLPAQSAGA